MPQSSRSIELTSFGVVPSANCPEDALSAILSTTLMSQLLIRLPTTSIANSRYSVARMTSPGYLLDVQSRSLVGVRSS